MAFETLKDVLDRLGQDLAEKKYSEPHQKPFIPRSENAVGLDLTNVPQSMVWLFDEDFNNRLDALAENLESEVNDESTHFTVQGSGCESPAPVL